MSVSVVLFAIMVPLIVIVAVAVGITMGSKNR